MYSGVNWLVRCKGNAAPFLPKVWFVRFWHSCSHGDESTCKLVHAYALADDSTIVRQHPLLMDGSLSTTRAWASTNSTVQVVLAQLLTMGWVHANRDIKAVVIVS